MDADAVIEALALEPHPEGGWYRRVWTHPVSDDRGRAQGSAIYFLLRAGDVAGWHRVDVPEMWHHYAGAPLRLEVSEDGESVERHVLGTDLTAGERPQLVVPASAWQSSRSLGAWTLTGCTLSPGFDWDGWELAADGWVPGQS